MTEALAAPTASVVLDDGRSVTIRGIRADDTDRLRALHRSLSARTMRLRFFAYIPELPLSQAERFSHVDHDGREALVAEAVDGSIVAVVRYDRLPDSDDAEVALLVRDDYQRHHLGTLMLDELVMLALSHGITRFVAEVLPENGTVLGVMRHAGLPVTVTYGEGVCHVAAPLTAQPAPTGEPS
jgi:RimJ/RimL family protein N-acetyltransferase